VGDFALVEQTPFGAPPHGIDGGQVERVAGDPRSRGREEGRGRMLATFPDDRKETDVRDQCPRIRKAGEAAQLPEEGAGGIRAHPGQGLQQGGIRGTTLGSRRRQQGLPGLVEVVDRRGEALELGEEGAHDVTAGVRGLAAIGGLPRTVAQRGGVLERKSPRAGGGRGPAQGGRGGVGKMPSGGKDGEQPAGARGRGVAEARAMLREHDVELGHELPEVILTLAHQACPQANQLAQTLDLFVGDVAGRRGLRAEQSGDDIGIDVVGLGFAAQDIPVASGLQGIEDDAPIAGAAQESLEVFPEVARGFQPDQGVPGRGPAGVQGAHEVGEAFLAGENREALPSRFAIGAQDGHSVVAQGHGYPHTVQGVHTPPQAPQRRESGLCRTGLPNRRGRITWSIMRDGGSPPPSILDECSRPGGRDATVSSNRSSFRRPE